MSVNKLPENFLPVTFSLDVYAQCLPNQLRASPLQPIKTKQKPVAVNFPALFGRLLSANEPWCHDPWALHPLGRHRTNIAGTQEGSEVNHCNFWTILFMGCLFSHCAQTSSSTLKSCSWWHSRTSSWSLRGRLFPKETARVSSLSNQCRQVTAALGGQRTASWQTGWSKVAPCGEVSEKLVHRAV